MYGQNYAELVQIKLEISVLIHGCSSIQPMQQNIVRVFVYDKVDGLAAGLKIHMNV